MFQHGVLVGRNRVQSALDADKAKGMSSLPHQDYLLAVDFAFTGPIGRLALFEEKLECGRRAHILRPVGLMGDRWRREQDERNDHGSECAQVHGISPVHRRPAG